MSCPVCGAPALFAPPNPWRPFCSERCRLVDLGAWANEDYRIPAKPDEGGDTTEEESGKEKRDSGREFGDVTLIRFGAGVAPQSN